MFHSVLHHEFWLTLVWFLIKRTPWFLWYCWQLLLEIIFVVPFYLVAAYVARVIAATICGYKQSWRDASYYWRIR